MMLLAVRRRGGPRIMGNARHRPKHAVKVAPRQGRRRLTPRFLCRRWCHRLRACGGAWPKMVLFPGRAAEDPRRGIVPQVLV